jgi:tRNA threonylcarbamoyladenosine biosynthesis protein TsaE
MPMKMKEVKTHSSEETFQEGVKLGKTLETRKIIALFGDLGSGKTTFLKGFISSMTGRPPEEITSPTFTYLHVYTGKATVYHFDLYRLSSPRDFFLAGFDEYLQTNDICCIEWAEKIDRCFLEHAIQITLSHQGQDTRLITIGDFA